MNLPNQIDIKIKGKPKPQKRHRHTKKGFTYDPSSKDKKDFIAQLQFLPYVKKHYRTGKFSKELKPNPPISYRIKPDIDNLLKFVMDAGNGVLWKDDSQIYKVDMEKVYSVNGYTKITVVEDNWED